MKHNCGRCYLAAVAKGSDCSMLQRREAAVGKDKLGIMTQVRERKKLLATGENKYQGVLKFKVAVITLCVVVAQSL